MMPRTTNAVVLVLFAAFVVFGVGCAEREDPASIPIQAHPEGWTNPADEDFHGVYLNENFDAVREALAEDPSLEPESFRGVADGCRSCHGQALGFQSQEQCLSCHASGNVESGGHPAPSVYLAPQDDGFHGKVIAEAMSTDQCQVCHGVEYDGGWSAVSCVACHEGGRSGHPSTDAMFRPSSDDYHATRLAERGPGNCAECHGEKGGGGWTTVACTTCHAGNPANAGGLSGHPSVEVWNDSSSDDFHGAQDFDDCRPCHGEDLLGGPFLSAEYPRLSCNACHTWPLTR